MFTRQTPARPLGRSFAAVAFGAVIAVSLAACSSSGGSASSGAGTSQGSANSGASGSAVAGGPVTVNIAQDSGTGGTPASIKIQPQAALRAELPQRILDSGELRIGVGALPSTFPPIVYYANDNRTIIGTDPDLARAVGAVLGVKTSFSNFTWDNMFVAIDSGKVDAGFSNITDTEQRKQKYDFAAYRQDDIAFAVKADNSLSFNASAPNPWDQLAGLTVAVGPGTNQEKILLEFQAKLKAEGKKLTVKYFPDEPTTYQALASGKIDAYLEPNPSVAFEVTSTAGTAQAVKNAGTYSGAGASLQGLIAATTQKGNGLAKPIADALNYLIQNGQYKSILDAYADSGESVTSAEVNPPGLPLDNS